jgi:hypothetical protein
MTVNPTAERARIIEIRKRRIRLLLACVATLEG